jgi:hypothetical protein
MGAYHDADHPLVGRKFLDRDHREPGRVLRLISFATDKNGYEIKDKYEYQVITNPTDPSRVNTKGKITGATLAEHYTDLSHNGKEDE